GLRLHDPQGGGAVMTAPSLCSQIVSRGRYSTRCMNRAKVERNGRLYCSTHDPEAVKAKNVAWNQAFNQRMEQDRAQERAALARARELAVGGPQQPPPPNPQTIHPGGFVWTPEEADRLIARLQEAG